MVDTVIIGGRVVQTNEVVVADILVSEGRIAGIVAPSMRPEADTVIDATGKYVLPGVIDVHVHPYIDGWGGTLRAAAYGGVTTVLFMMKHGVQEELSAVLSHGIGEVERDAVIDFGFHVVLRQPFKGSDIYKAVDLGASSFKVFMAHMNRDECLSDATMFEAFRHVSAAQGLCLVHAETGDIGDVLEGDQRSQGRIRARDYVAAHPPLLEANAVATAIDMAALAECPLYLVHITTKAALERLRAARATQRSVLAETCLPFLLLTSNDLAERGPIMKVAPALRPREDVESLWEALRENELQVVSSDHAAQLGSVKTQSVDIFDAPSGLPGTELLLPLLFSEGVVKRGMRVEWLARVLSEQPARIFGLHPQKGGIRIGADADLVIFDPRHDWVVSAEQLQSGAGYTPYEGWEVHGRATATLVRGHVVLADGTIRASAGYGRYIRRSVASFANSPAAVRRSSGNADSNGEGLGGIPS